MKPVLVLPVLLMVLLASAGAQEPAAKPETLAKPEGAGLKYRFPEAAQLRYRYTATATDAFTDVIGPKGENLAHEGALSRMMLDFKLATVPAENAAAPGGGETTTVDLSIKRMRLVQDFQGERYEEILGAPDSNGKGEWVRTLNGLDVIPEGKRDSQLRDIEKLLAAPTSRILFSSGGPADSVEEHPDLARDRVRRTTYNIFVRLPHSLSPETGTRPLPELLAFCFPGTENWPKDVLSAGTTWTATLDKFLRTGEGKPSPYNVVKLEYRTESHDAKNDLLRIRYTGTILPKEAPDGKPRVLDRTEREKNPHQFPRAGDKPGDELKYDISGLIEWKPKAGRLELHAMVYRVRNFVETLAGLRAVSKATFVYRARFISPERLVDRRPTTEDFPHNNEVAADLSPEEQRKIEQAAGASGK